MKRVYKVLPICLIVLGLVCPGCRPSSTAQLEENKAIVRRWIEERDKVNWVIFKELLAPDFVFHGPESPKPLTREETEQSARMFCAAFPDESRTIGDMIAEGNKVVIRITYRATHKGDLQGIPATGKEVAITVISIFRIAAGKIVEAWVEEDEMGLMRQFGAIPAVGEQEDRPVKTDAEAEETTGFVTVNGTTLTYLIEGAGIPCLVNGWGRYYRRIFSKELRKDIKFIFADFRTLYDLDTPIEVRKITMDTLVDDIEQVRKALGFDKIAVLGHSDPGLVALEYGRKYPEHTSHIIMIGTPPYAYSSKYYKELDKFWESDAPEERKAIWKRNYERLTKETISSMSPSEAWNKTLTKEAVSSMSAYEAWIKRYVADTPLLWYDPTYDCSWLWEGNEFNVDFANHFYGVRLKDYDITQTFHQITVPVFVALGRYDYGAGPYYLWDDVKDKLPNLSYNLFEKRRL